MNVVAEGSWGVLASDVPADEHVPGRATAFGGDPRRREYQRRMRDLALRPHARLDPVRLMSTPACRHSCPYRIDRRAPESPFQGGLPAIETAGCVSNAVPARAAGYPFADTSAATETVESNVSGLQTGAVARSRTAASTLVGARTGIAASHSQQRERRGRQEPSAVDLKAVARRGWELRRAMCFLPRVSSAIWPAPFSSACPGRVSTVAMCRAMAARTPRPPSLSA